MLRAPFIAEAGRSSGAEKGIRMKPRMEHWKVAPGGFRAMSSLEAYLRESGLDKALLHMVKLRASQINGCAYCIDMHWKDARAGGESEQRLYGLDAWREASYYTDRERAALEWAEALTNEIGRASCRAR